MVKIDYIKFKKFCSSKDTTKSKMARNIIRENIFKTHMTKGSYAEY